MNSLDQTNLITTGKKKKSKNLSLLLHFFFLTQLAKSGRIALTFFF